MKRKWIAVALSISLTVAALTPVYAGEADSGETSEPSYSSMEESRTQEEEYSTEEPAAEDKQDLETREDKAVSALPSDNTAEEVTEEAVPVPEQEEALEQEEPAEQESSDETAQKSEEPAEEAAPAQETVTEDAAAAEEPAAEKPAAEETAQPAAEEAAQDTEEAAAASEEEPAAAQKEEEKVSDTADDLILDAPAAEETISEEAADTVYITGGSSRSSAKSFSVGLGSGESVIDNCKVVTTAGTSRKEYWYKFSTSSHDSFYTINFKNNSISDWVDFYLYDYDENQLWETSRYTNNTNTEKLKLNPYSVYYIKVVNSSLKAGNFQFYVTEHYDDVKDTVGSAQKLNLGTRYVRGLQSWYDQDNFYFHTSSNDSFYALTFKNLNMNTWVSAYLRTTDSETIAEIESYNNNSKARYVKLRPNTDYHIVVNENSGIDTDKIGTYSLTVTELIDDCPSTKSSAKLITRNVTRSGRINSDDSYSYPDTYTGMDEDWYKFKTGSITKNYFYVKNLNADGWLNAQVQDQYGEVIWSDDCYNGNEMRGNAILKSNSVYYLKISGPKGNYKYRVSCPIRVTKVTLNHTYVNLKVGSNYLLKATVYPSNASNKIVGWTSTNKAVAKVNTSGRVYGLKKGTATVYAITRDGGKRAACTIYVK